MQDRSVISALASVSTVLTPTERIRVDAAGEGSYRALHRDNVDDVVRDRVVPGADRGPAQPARGGGCGAVSCQAGRAESS